MAWMFLFFLQMFLIVFIDTNLQLLIKFRYCSIYEYYSYMVRDMISFKILKIDGIFQQFYNMCPWFS